MPRLIRWVRLGAAPEYTWVWGWATICSPSAFLSPSTWWQLAHRLLNWASPAERQLVGRASAAFAFWLRDPAFEVVRGERDDPHAHVGVGQAAELGALAPVLAGVRRPGGSTGCTRPGTASRLPLSFGIQNEWMTSREVMLRCTGRPAGMTISLAVTSGRPSSPAMRRVVELPPPLLAEHVDDQRVLRALALSSNSDLIVGTAMTASRMAGRMVRPISSAGLPWTCLGVASWPGRSRKRTTATMTTTKTMTPTTPAMMKTGHDEVVDLLGVVALGVEGALGCGRRHRSRPAATTPTASRRPSGRGAAGRPRPPRHVASRRRSTAANASHPVAAPDSRPRTARRSPSRSWHRHRRPSALVGAGLVLRPRTSYDAGLEELHGERRLRVGPDQVGAELDGLRDRLAVRRP